MPRPTGTCCCPLLKMVNLSRLIGHLLPTRWRPRAILLATRLAGMYSVSWHLLSIYSCSSFAHYLPPVGDEVHVFLSKILFSRRDFNTSDLIFAEASVSVAARRRLNLPRFSRRIFCRGQNQQTVESHYRRKQHSLSHTLTLSISFSQMLLSSRLCHCRHQQTVESEIR
jgi:hypothetical protein